MKKLFVQLLVILLALAMLTSCGTQMDKSSPALPVETESQAAAPESNADEEQESIDGSGCFIIPDAVDYRQYYGNILDSSLDIILGSTEFVDTVGGGTGLMEASVWQDTESALASSGYLIRDINGDNIPELMIGDIPQYEEGGSSIYALYTIVNDEPVLVIEGWARNRLELTEDGSIINRGSGGAAYTIFAEYSLPAGAAELVCEDYYFTHETDESFTEIAVYHNNSGEWDTAVSEKLDMQPDELWELIDVREASALRLPFTPFSDYPLADTGELTARFVSEDADLSGYLRVILDEVEPVSKLMFTPYDSLDDFTVLSIEYVETANGYGFSASELYYHGTLTADAPVVLCLTFAGDIPNYAVSYTDSNGQTRYYSIGISGKDGSLLLSEI